MEQEGREVAAVSRGQNVVYILPHDWASIAHFLGPAVDRIDDGAAELQLLVVASDVEVAAAVSAAAVKLAGDRDIAIVAATSARRTASVIKARPAQIIAATPETLVEMLKAATLKLETVRAVCIAWVDDLVARGSSATLETLMGELPKDGPRIVVTSELTPAVEELLERYARRARRVLAPATDTDMPVGLEYATVSPQTRLSTLHRLIDDSDPRSAFVFARDTRSSADVTDLLRTLGYSGSAATVTAGLVAAPNTELAILFDLPASRQELREAVAGAKRTIALVQPRQLSSLRMLTAGGIITPLTLPESGARARDSDARARAELRDVLNEGAFGRELLALEPLLDSFDGIEIAAAALQLLDRERAARAVAAAASGAPRERATGGAMAKLFLTVGSRDNVGPGDLVGAIANQAGISSSEIGKVEVRESHSVVEVAAAVAESVIEKVNGVEIRGRRVVVRLDQERPAREGGRSSGPREGRPREGGSRDGGRGRGDSSRDSSRGGPRDAKRGPPRDRDRSSAPRAPRSPRTGDRE